jgi:hypothetical protein
MNPIIQSDVSHEIKHKGWCDDEPTLPVFQKENVIDYHICRSALHYHESVSELFTLSV